MKVFVTGAAGQLGCAVMKELTARGHDVVGSIRYDAIRQEPDCFVKLDLTDRERTEAVLRREQPEAVVHCAAWTDVDAAERSENREQVFRINAEAAGTVARMCRETGAKLIYLSTDYVFDGSGSVPWRPEEKNLRPLNCYGQSKLAGERAVLELADRVYIVRISGLFGRGDCNFIRKILAAAAAGKSLRVVDDQIMRPTYAADLAVLLADMCERDDCGIYHASNEGPFISWYQLACEILRLAGIRAEVQPVPAGKPREGRAVRPLNSRLDTSLLAECGFTPLPDWRNALERYFAGEFARE